MRFLLDTNALIELLRGNQKFIDRLGDYRTADFGVSAVSHHELCFGAYKSKRVEENLRMVHVLEFEVLPLSQTDAERGGEIRAALAAKRTPIGPYDVLIAGQAIARSLTLITRNTREFKRVEGLTFENWLE